MFRLSDEERCGILSILHAKVKEGLPNHRLELLLDSPHDKDIRLALDQPCKDLLLFIRDTMSDPGFGWEVNAGNETNHFTLPTVIS